MLPRSAVKLSGLVLLALLLLQACRTAPPTPPRAYWRWMLNPPEGEGALIEPVPGERPAPAAQPEWPAPIPLLIADESVYTLQLRGSELGHALQMIADMGGLNLVLVGEFGQTVEVHLPSVRLQTALEMLLRTYACTIEVLGETSRTLEEEERIVVVRRDDPTDMRTQIFDLVSITAESVQVQLATIVGEENLVADPLRNVVMVTGPPNLLRESEAYLKIVDRPQRQVLIEARILEVSRRNLEEIGTKLEYGDISMGNWTGTFISSLLTSSTQVLATASNEDGTIDYAINALHELKGLRVLSRPRLLALNNREAKLDIITEVPYIDSTTTTEQGTVGTQIVEAVEFKLVGLRLIITPTIQEDGLIAILLDQEVSNQTGEFLGVPIVDSRHITTSFVVENGKTILIGGIMNDSLRTTNKGVPLLEDIPLLGGAFRSDESDEESGELVILITPRIVDPGSN